MTDTPVILPTSAEAATYRTDIKGWVSRTGRYFGDDERVARLYVRLARTQMSIEDRGELLFTNSPYGGSQRENTDFELLSSPAGRCATSVAR